MRLEGLLVWISILCHAVFANSSRTGKKRSCMTQVGLRDKWLFLHQGRRPFVRIRRGALIFRNGKYRMRFQCLQRFGNIYLLRKSNYDEDRDAVVCIGFSYIADHPYAEYSAIRLMGQGIGSHVLSPVLLPHGTPVSINRTCELKGPTQRRQYSFMKRADPGCKFPKKLQKSWNFTYLHARRLHITLTRMELLLLDGKRLVFTCQTRDSHRYLVRAHGFPTPELDSYMCINFVPVRDDPFYTYIFSRLNSGDLMDGLLRVVNKGQPIRMHQDCDWLDSPARPEFLYP